MASLLLRLDLLDLSLFWSSVLLSRICNFDDGSGSLIWSRREPSLLFFLDFETLPDFPLCWESISFIKFMVFSSKRGGLVRGELTVMDYRTGASKGVPRTPIMRLAFSIDFLFLF